MPLVSPAAPRAGIRTAAVFAIFAAAGIILSTWAARLPAIRDALGIEVDAVGLLIFAMGVGAIAGLLAAGHVVHLLGTRRTILIPLLIGAAAFAGVGVGAQVASLPAVSVSIVLVGAMASMCDVAMNVEGAAVEHAIKRPIMPWFHAAWSLSTVVGAAIGAAAAFGGVPVAVHFGVAAALIAATALVATRGLPAHTVAEGEERLGFRRRLAIWVEPRTLLIGVLVLGMAFAEGAANDWLTLAMVDDRGHDEGTGALLFGMFTAAMTVGRIIGVPLLARFGRVTVLTVASLAAMAGLATVIVVPATPITAAAIVLWGLGASLGFPVGMSAAGDDPAHAAARVSAVATIAYCAFLVGPPVIGWVAAGTGLLPAMWIVVALIAVASLAIPVVRERPAVAPADDAPHP